MTNVQADIATRGDCREQIADFGDSFWEPKILHDVEANEFHFPVWGGDAN